MRATDLRQRLGYSNLRSTLINDIDITSKDVVFHGTGYGHGVGMCQWGANGMAQAGHVAPEILARYYPGTELRRMYYGNKKRHQPFHCELDEIVMDCYEYGKEFGRDTIWRKYKQNFDDLTYDTLRAIHNKRRL